jgi:tetratricopeptide (TPR) repeat protein
MPACAPERWAFLDTETTGLAGGSGTYAFLIGVGRICADGFRVRQFFLREHAEERSVLNALARHLADFDALITYNGRTYDQPLLETRYRMIRERPPFSRLPHLDLLYGARRLWKLRLESCKLTQLEAQILGYQRDGDIPGHLIPHVYFDYLRSGRAHALVPVFRHNALDIATLACLTALVPAIFHSAGTANPLLGWHPKHGADLVGIARWLLAEGDPERALQVFQRAIDAGLPDQLLFRCLWDVALLEKKLGRPYAAVAIFTELSNCRNEYRARAFEELAKFYEHKEKNYALALDFTCEAMRFSASDSLTSRKQRLEARIAAAPRRQRLMLI